MKHFAASTYTKTQSSSLSAIEVRQYTAKPPLKIIYYSHFNSHLIYACQTWGQSKTELFNKVKISLHT